MTAAHEYKCYGAIGVGNGPAAANLKRALDTARGGPVVVRVHSAGGDALQALACLSLLRGYPGRVVVQIDGLCSGPASALIGGATEVVMAPDAVLSLWQPPTGAGPAGDKIGAAFAEVYRRRLPAYAQVLVQRWCPPGFLTAREAVAHGLADRIGPPVPPAALAAALPRGRHGADLHNCGPTAQAPAPRPAPKPARANIPHDRCNMTYDTKGKGRPLAEYAADIKAADDADAMVRQARSGGPARVTIPAPPVARPAVALTPDQVLADVAAMFRQARG